MPDFAYDIFFDEGDNLGGARSFRYALLPEIATLPYPVQFTVFEAITFNEGGRYYVVRIIDDTGNFTEDQSRGSGGTQWITRFQAQAAANVSYGEAYLDTASRFPVVAEVTDSNGVVRRIGTLTAPAWITFKRDSGRGPAGGNRWTISIEDYLSELPCPRVDLDFVPVVYPFAEVEPSES